MLNLKICAVIYHASDWYIIKTSYIYIYDTVFWH